jgi:hypothetical protein
MVNEINQKTNEEQVREDFLESIRYYEEKVRRLKKEMEEFVEVGRRIGEEEWEVGVAYYSEVFNFQTKNSEEAIEVVNKLLTLFPEIEKFRKEFNSGYDRWDWSGNSGRVWFVVNNATPDPNCKPTEEIRTYKSWTCQRQKGLR